MESTQITNTNDMWTPTLNNKDIRDVIWLILLLNKYVGELYYSAGYSVKGDTYICIYTHAHTRPHKSESD